MTGRERRHLARCTTCRENGEFVGDALRGLPEPALTTAERERVWRGIVAAHGRQRAWSLELLVAWLRGFGRRRPALVWAPAVACALLLIVAPLHVGREDHVLSQATLNAQTVVERVDALGASSVLVVATPTSHVQVIWVNEAEPGGPR